ncbi:MAG: DEAD/DEAH box helicase [Verrucomicrobia bacterium]|nr:DEAD/DEAH box helicase [Verrucomicrobiota bacterium]
MPVSLALSPEGNLLIDDWAEEVFCFAKTHEAAARQACEQGNGAVLRWLAALASGSDLPAPAVYWREFAGLWLTAFCHRRSDAMATPGDAEMARFLETCPPLRGSEYLSLAVLQGLWQDFGTEVARQIAGHPQGTDGWLRETLPHWHLVGRVTFHMAENKRDAERPFAFLATYTSGLTPDGKARHVLLQQAIKEYAGAQNRASLLQLLEPVSLAAGKSPWLAAQVESGDIYRQQAWRPAEALQFLKAVRVFEECGLAVRIPDWWQPAAPPRPQVSVTVGGERPSALGLDSLLSFQIEVTLDGERLSREELEALRTAQGLVMVKGKWVEADAEKIQAVLKHWQDAQTMHFADGVSFQQALRLLSGSGIDPGEAKLLTLEAQEWSGIRAGPWLTDLLTRLRDPAQLDAINQHPDLHAELRPYQRVGVAWLYFMTRLGLGACLADDMGLGKTIQVLALLLHLKREHPAGGPALLVVPASLLANWQAEAAKFAPALQLFIAHPAGGEPAKLTALAKGKTTALAKADLVVTTYGMLPRMPVLKAHPWRMAILDEAQAIKNPAAAQTQAVKEVNAKTRLVLTGTPVENRLGDLWSLFDFINAGLLGNGAAFSRFVKSLSQQAEFHYAPLRRLVRPYILRRLKTDKSIIGDLPDKTEMTVWCQLTKQQAVLYQGVVEQLVTQLKTSDGMKKRGLILAALMNFKQICNHPSQFSADGHYNPSHSGKFTRLEELCLPIAERQEKILVFTQFTALIPALRQHLKGVFKRDGLVLTGQTPIKQRRTLVEEFQRDSGPPFFLLSLKAGGTGLTLTAASHVIHFDRWWNPAVENQATDRAFRIGQKKNVLVHKFVCRGTLEEKIDAMIEEKRGVADGVLAEGGEIALTEMSDAELLHLVSLDLNQINTNE